MKTLTYDKDKIIRAVRDLNRIAFLDSENTQGFTGIEKSRLIAEIADILDQGMEGEIFEKEEHPDGAADSKNSSTGCSKDMAD